MISAEGPLPFPRDRFSWIIASFLFLALMWFYYIHMFPRLELAYRSGFIYAEDRYSETNYATDDEIEVRVAYPRYLSSIAERPLLVSVTNRRDEELTVTIVPKVIVADADLTQLFVFLTSLDRAGNRRQSGVMTFIDIPPDATVSQEATLQVIGIQKTTAKVNLKFDLALPGGPDRAIDLDNTTPMEIDTQRTLIQNLISFVLLPPWANGFIPLLALFAVYLFGLSEARGVWGYRRLSLYGWILLLFLLAVLIIWTTGESAIWRLCAPPQESASCMEIDNLNRIRPPILFVLTLFFGGLAMFIDHKFINPKPFGIDSVAKSLDKLLEECCGGNIDSPDNANDNGGNNDEAPIVNREPFFGRVKNGVVAFRAAFIGGAPPEAQVIALPAVAGQPSLIETQPVAEPITQLAAPQTATEARPIRHFYYPQRRNKPTTRPAAPQPAEPPPQPATPPAESGTSAPEVSPVQVQPAASPVADQPAAPQTATEARPVRHFYYVRRPNKPTTRPAEPQPAEPPPQPPVLEASPAQEQPAAPPPVAEPIIQPPAPQLAEPPPQPPAPPAESGTSVPEASPAQEQPAEQVAQPAKPKRSRRATEKKPRPGPPQLANDLPTHPDDAPPIQEPVTRPAEEGDVWTKSPPAVPGTGTQES